MSKKSLPGTPKQEAIQAAALDLFSRYGLHGTSLDQVASLAGLSKSNLLYYFASKEELYIDLLSNLLDLWLAPLRAIGAEQDPAEAIAQYIRLKMINSRDHPQASRLFCLEMIQGAPLLKPALEGTLRELVDAKAGVVRAWVAAGRLQPVDPHHLFFSLWALTQHYADFSVQVQSITGRTLDDPAFFEQALASVQGLILRGIGVEAGELSGS
ncbi:HTH-type transcriptional regulator RutR [Pseudomonas kuykendallii]|uniref:Transcriptional regulator, TetR family n=1 Tax=Pseudomonas kuykendallii TaxID=1007099 RepID=A0A1H2RFZ0_9PSED|nr:HTH-type transcriptional regulator RutR [Pseudomonas kuykendallii]MCQ4272744.1 HTH-type transcriptional regulator RutR [Pseudomonas kuykendallii]SDW18307.1 transcriptional regulator, TetR family [Pseudomonas kuykendallii]